MSHMPGHVFCQGSKSGVWSWGHGSGLVLLSQVPGSNDWLGNWSGDEIGVVLIRWKNDLGMLQVMLFFPELSTVGSCKFWWWSEVHQVLTEH